MILFVRNIIKSVLSIIYNWRILYLGSIGYPFYIDRGLRIHAPKRIFLGKNVTIGRYSRLSSYITSDPNNYITIEDGCYIGQFFTAIGGGVRIKKNTLIASYVSVISENHSIDLESGILYGKQPLSGKYTEIGECCWIGEKVIVLPGVHIGDWCIVGAGSVVTNDIPSYSIAVGNPAKVIKKYDFYTQHWVKV